MKTKKKCAFVVCRSDSLNSFVSTDVEELLAALRYEIVLAKKAKATLSISTQLFTEEQLTNIGEFDSF